MGAPPSLPASLKGFAGLRVSVAAALGSACVVEVTLCRPQKLNALGASFWAEFPLCMRALNAWPPCRCVLLTAEGPAFCSGLDLCFLGEQLQQFAPETTQEGLDPARRALRLHQLVQQLQAALSSLEALNSPVVAAVSGPCVGAGVDLLCCCDVRLCAADSLFSVKEVDAAMAPDLGTLQRLPLLVRSGSWVREVCFSGRSFSASEAEREGFVSAVLPDREALQHAAVTLGLSLATKSPVAVAAIKRTLNNSRGRTVADSLFQQAAESAAALQTEDLLLALQRHNAGRRKRADGEDHTPFACL